MSPILRRLRPLMLRELCGNDLVICANRWKVTCEGTNVASQQRLTLKVERIGDFFPGVKEGKARLNQTSPCRAVF